MDKTIYLTTIDLKTAVEKNINKLAVPIYEDGKELFDKINGDFRAEVSMVRNPGHHRKLFAILNLATSNGLLQKMIKHDIIVNEMDGYINYEKVEMLKIIYKTDIEIIRYLLKWMFLPLEPLIDANFNKTYQVSSIKFSKMDQIQFTEFYDNVIDYVSKKLNVPINILEREAGNDL